MYAHMPRCIQYKLVMCKMRFEFGSNRVTSELTQTNWVLRCDFGYSDRPGNYMLWFCTPKSLQNVPKSAQIPKSCISDILYWASPNHFSSPPQIWVKFESDSSTRIQILVLGFRWGIWHSKERISNSKSHYSVTTRMRNSTGFTLLV